MKSLYMKKILTAAFLILFAGYANAQINNPVIWTYTAKKIADKTYELHMTATIGSNWHLYAQPRRRRRGFCSVPMRWPRS